MFERWPVVPLLGLTLFILGCQGLQPAPSGSGNNGGGGTPQASLESINHIVFMLQENRSFDSYFGQLPAYWQANGFPAQQFDGLPAGASNPSFDGLSTVGAYHLQTECFANLSPSWNESHVDRNRQDPSSATATMDGYTFTAASYAASSASRRTASYRHGWNSRDGLLRRHGPELLLLHGIKFRDVGPVVLASHVPHSAESALPDGGDLRGPRLSADRDVHRTRPFSICWRRQVFRGRFMKPILPALT